MLKQFFVSEESGEKLYKLITIRLSHEEMMKIISKEGRKKRIHFIIRLSRTDPGSGAILNEETKYKSAENGVTQRQFDNMVQAITEKLPPDAEITIHDLSNYGTLMDQFSTGVMDGFLRTGTINQSNELH